MQEIQNRLKHLLKLYADQEISDLEEAELIELINASENDHYIKGVLLNMLEEESEIALPDKEKWEPVLKNILSQKNIENKFDSGTVYGFSQRKVVKSWKNLAYKAAAVAVLIGVGLFYLVSRKNDRIDLRNISKSTLIKDIPAPNSNNAVLTLSNGVEIILDSMGNGTVVQQGSVDVVKLAEGEITYSQNPSLASEENEVGFNTLANPRGSKVVNLILGDGTKVWLNAESSLRFPTFFKGATRSVEITGEAYFEVAHDKTQPFHVSVNNVDVEVLGTHFNINSYDGETTTTLLEGSVKVSKNNETASLRPGQQAVVKSAFIKVVNTPDIEDVMAWKNGRFSFHDAALETIMSQMARWYNVEVVYNDKINDHYTVNVARNIPVSQLFKFIEMSGGVHFSIEGNKIIVKK